MESCGPAEGWGNRWSHLWGLSLAWHRRVNVFAGAGKVNSPLGVGALFCGSLAPNVAEACVSVYFCTLSICVHVSSSNNTPCCCFHEENPRLWSVTLCTGSHQFVHLVKRVWGWICGWLWISACALIHWRVCSGTVHPFENITFCSAKGSAGCSYLAPWDTFPNQWSPWKV